MVYGGKITTALTNNLRAHIGLMSLSCPQNDFVTDSTFADSGLSVEGGEQNDVTGGQATAEGPTVHSLPVLHPKSSHSVLSSDKFSAKAPSQDKPKKKRHTNATEGIHTKSSKHSAEHQDVKVAPLAATLPLPVLPPSPKVQEKEVSAPSKSTAKKKVKGSPQRVKSKFGRADIPAGEPSVKPKSKSSKLKSHGPGTHTNVLKKVDLPHSPQTSGPHHHLNPKSSVAKHSDYKKHGSHRELPSFSKVQKVVEAVTPVSESEGSPEVSITGISPEQSQSFHPSETKVEQAKPVSKLGNVTEATESTTFTPLKLTASLELPASDQSSEKDKTFTSIHVDASAETSNQAASPTFGSKAIYARTIDPRDLNQHTDSESAKPSLPIDGSLATSDTADPAEITDNAEKRLDTAETATSKESKAATLPIHKGSEFSEASDTLEHIEAGAIGSPQLSSSDGVPLLATLRSAARPGLAPGPLEVQTLSVEASQPATSHRPLPPRHQHKLRQGDYSSQD